MAGSQSPDLMFAAGKISQKRGRQVYNCCRRWHRARLFRHNGAPIVGSGSFDADSVLPDSTRFATSPAPIITAL